MKVNDKILKINFNIKLTFLHRIFIEVGTNVDLFNVGKECFYFDKDI